MLHEHCWDAQACMRADEMMHPAPLAMRYQRSCRRWNQAHGCSSYCVAAGFFTAKAGLYHVQRAQGPQTILSNPTPPPAVIYVYLGQVAILLFKSG